jgi:hypothetical protein
MLYSLLADGVLLLHLGFVLFVIGGGLLSLRWPRVAWLHLPAACWGAAVEFSGSVCPLTPLENALRRLAGEAGYSGGFVEHYLLPILYPHDLGPGTRYLLGALVVVINVAVYLRVWRRCAHQAGHGRGR